MMTEPSITGTTRLVFVVADPVFQLRTPQALNNIWADRRQDLVALPAHVAASDLRDFLQGFRVNRSVAGAVITVPHKQTVVELCDELGPNALGTGAVNAIKRTSDGRLVGETFDGLGFVAGLRSRGFDPRGRSVLVMGAGGAASAVALALANSGAARIHIENRTQSRADSLVTRLRATGFAAAFADAGDPRQADLVVNATSFGMSPTDEAEFDAERLSPSAIAADVIVSNELTPFLAAASAHGLTVHEGRHMLHGQMQLIADYLTECQASNGRSLEFIE